MNLTFIRQWYETVIYIIAFAFFLTNLDNHLLFDTYFFLIKYKNSTRKKSGSCATVKSCIFIRTSGNLI